jgi:hypothetical protein
VLCRVGSCCEVMSGVYCSTPSTYLGRGAVAAPRFVREGEREESKGGGSLVGSLLSLPRPHFPRPLLPRLLLLPRSTPNAQRSRPQSFFTPASISPLTTNHFILTTTTHHPPSSLPPSPPPLPAHTLPADERPGAARRVKGALPLPHSSAPQPARLCSGTKGAPIRSLSLHTRPCLPLTPTRRLQHALKCRLGVTEHRSAVQCDGTRPGFRFCASRPAVPAPTLYHTRGPALPIQLHSSRHARPPRH